MHNLPQNSNHWTAAQLVDVLIEMRTRYRLQLTPVESSALHQAIYRAWAAARLAKQLADQDGK